MAADSTVPGARRRTRTAPVPAGPASLAPAGPAPLVVAPPPSTGRPSKFTAANQAAILANIRAGLFAMDAVRAIPDPIDYSTYGKWRADAEARQELSPYFVFFQEVHKAEVEWKAAHVKNITEASARDWHASGWILARMYPDQYADQSRRTVQHTGTVQVQHVQALDAGALNQVYGLLGAGGEEAEGTARELLPGE